MADSLTAGQKQAQAYLNLIMSRSPSDYYSPVTDNMLYADPDIQRMLTSSEGSYDPNDFQNLLNKRRDMMNNGQQQQLAQDTYNKYLKQAKDSVTWWNQHPNGDSDFMDNFMGNVFPLIVAGGMAGGALGLFGDAAASTASGLGASDGLAGLTDLAPGTMPTLGSADALSGLGDVLPGFSSGVGAADTGATLGDIAAGGAPAMGDAGAANTVMVNGSTAGTGLSPGVLPTLGAGAADLPNIGSGYDDSWLNNYPVVAPPLSNAGTPTGSDILGDANSTFGVVPPISAGGTGSIPNIPGIGSSGGNTNTGNGLGGLNLGNLLGLLQGNRDRITNQQDSDFWKQQMDKMLGFYNPGTPEANLLEQRMNAKDAAAGRNSQYGTRMTDLAGILAGQRAQIMTSPGYLHAADAYRGHYSNSLDSLFTALNGFGGSNLGGGNAGGGSNSLNLGSILGGLGNLGSSLGNLFSGSGTSSDNIGNTIGNSVGSSLGNLFGGASIFNGTSTRPPDTNASGVPTIAYNRGGPVRPPDTSTITPGTTPTMNQAQNYSNQYGNDAFEFVPGVNDYAAKYAAAKQAGSLDGMSADDAFAKMYGSQDYWKTASNQFYNGQHPTVGGLNQMFGTNYGALGNGTGT